MKLVREPNGGTVRRGLHCYYVCNCKSPKEAALMDYELRKDWNDEWSGCPDYKLGMTASFFIDIIHVEDFKYSYKKAKVEVANMMRQSDVNIDYEALENKLWSVFNGASTKLEGSKLLRVFMRKISGKYLELLRDKLCDDYYAEANRFLTTGDEAAREASSKFIGTVAYGGAGELSKDQSLAASAVLNCTLECGSVVVCALHCAMNTVALDHNKVGDELYPRYHADYIDYINILDDIVEKGVCV